jgi:hypothetical protein
MASVSSRFSRAVALHREAVSHTASARAELAGREADSGLSPQSVQAQRLLAARLDKLATSLTRGWLGCPLDGSAAQFKIGVDADRGRPMHLRIGEATPVPDATFRVVLPFVGVGHISVDRDARNPRVAGWLRAMLLRTVAALPDGALRVLPVDGGTLGAVFAPFRQLVDADLWLRPATDVDGMRAILEQAEAQIALAQTGSNHDLPYLVIAMGALPIGSGNAEYARLAALAHAGPAARVHLLLAGYPPTGHSGYDVPPGLDHTTYLSGRGDRYTVSEPPGADRFDDNSGGLAIDVDLDSAPVDRLIERVCQPISTAARAQHSIGFGALMPDEVWKESSANGLRTVVGRDGREWCELALDDVTPHWLVGGRTGSGKTIFLLDVLYGLASRYSPDELVMYLLDFKEGVSFTEFTPTALDGSWIPHARTVGVESDREYGLAVLRELSREMGRRATELKRAGVTRIVDLRAGRPDAAMPRIVAVIDEFHVLFDGNDSLAARAAALLEELARKGRSYGIHLILASQTISGVEALFTKADSIFGQFPLRVALAGGGGVLHHLNEAANNLPVGTAVVNSSAGVSEANRQVRFPNTDPTVVTAQRHRLWRDRTPGSPVPEVFAGYEEHHLDDDQTYRQLSSDVRRRLALVGRAIDVGLPTVGFPLDASPGRHVAVLGSSPIGADILHAAVASLARQHARGSARFVLAPAIAAADGAADDIAEEVRLSGHVVEIVDLSGLRDHVRKLANTATAVDGRTSLPPTYLVILGADAASSALAASSDPTTFQSDLDRLRTLMRSGPGAGIHLLGWWRGIRRFGEDIGGSAGLEDMACLVALNVAAGDLSSLLGDYKLEWHARPNRALLVDRHEGVSRLIVPFVRPGTLAQFEQG